MGETWGLQVRIEVLVRVTVTVMVHLGKLDDRHIAHELTRNQNENGDTHNGCSGTERFFPDDSSPDSFGDPRGV